MIALLLACIHPTPPGPSPIERLQDLDAVVLQPAQGSQIVYLQATVRAGSAYDPVGQEGLAWLTAQMLRQGGAGERSPEQVDALLYDLAAELEVVVDKDLVTVRGKALAEDADRFVPLFVDIVTEPAWDQAAFERLRSQAESDLSVGILSSEEALGDAVFDAWLHEGHPYGHPVQGRTGVLPTLTLEQVQGFHADAWVRQATTLGLAGAVDQSLADQVAGELLQGLAATEPLESTPKPRAEIHGRQLLVVEKPTASTGWHFGHPLDVQRDHPDYAALYLAMVHFGDHRESHGRLYKNLRTARGMNYGDYAYVEHYVQQGWSRTQETATIREQPQFSVWLRPTDADNGPFAVKLALQLTEDLVTEGLSQEQFESTREYLLMRMKTWAQDPGRRLGFAVEAEAMDLPNQLEDLPASIEALDLSQVNGALQTWIHPEDLRLVAVTGDGQALVDSLTEGSATPIVYRGVEPEPEQAKMDQEIAAKQLALDSWDIVPAEGIFR
jgi:zinc protease